MSKLCTKLCYISNFQIAQPGQEIILKCGNMSNYGCSTFWFRRASGNTIQCMATMNQGHGQPAYCNEFKSGNIDMYSNITTVFLKIKKVDFSDSGLYFCGFYTQGLPVFCEVHLKVSGKVILDKFYLYRF
uniref:Immunoglobulin domain-containing protein n=1 Tax=Mola mola TaxID=94237 RepID=A0A3Q3W2P0_MOLML